jgi:predicted dehydrogenase
MEKKLKLGLIGTGNICRHTHLPAWLAHPEVEIAAVCDTDQKSAEELAKTCGISKVFFDYRLLLQDADIDIVDITVPNAFHSEISIAALQAGKHVLCEKPDAVTPTAAQIAADQAKVSGKLLLYMRNNRFRPSSQFLKKFVEKGRMGEIYTGRCGWIRRREMPPIGWFTDKAQSGGGPLIDLGVHFIDLTMWLMGNPKAVTVSGATYNKFGEKHLTASIECGPGHSSIPFTYNVEDLASGFIRFDNGATLQIEFSWASNIEEENNFLELRGTDAGFSLVNDTLKIFTEVDGAICDIYPRFPSDRGGHGRYIHHFVDCILRDVQPTLTPEDGVEMIKILSAIYESARIGKEISL